MDVARRLKFALAGLLVVLGSALTAAPALADTQPDPTEANIPYLAWRGEEVRLVKCHQSISPTGAGQRADLILVDWSGEEHALAVPHFEPSTAGFFAPTGPDHGGNGCVAGNFTSQKAGLAQIKLVVSAVPIGTGVVGSSITGPVGTPVLKHDFLVGWMNLNPPVLSASNAGSTGPPPITTNPADLTDVAGGAPNNFRVDVTGNIPLRANFRELGLGDTLTMPADWPRLASVFGTHFHPNNPAPQMMWDIHDDRLQTEGHGRQSVCLPLQAAPVPLIDAVDNCPQLFTTATGAPLFPLFGAPPELGPFSRIWRNPTFPTIGPFDPLVPSQTLLTDGNLNAEDAPMPAARIDFTSSGGGFFGCVGSATPAGSPQCAVARGGSPPFVPFVPEQLAKDKHVLYSRSGTGAQFGTTAATQHNLYAPFYGRFIPATARSYARNPAIGSNGFLPTNWVGVAEASGTAGPAGSILNPGAPGAGTPGFVPEPGGTNNFNGYLVNGLYHYWDIARVLSTATGAASNCVLRFNTVFSPAGAAATLFPQATITVTRTPVFRPLVAGPQNVVVYTDEHGEAHVWWYPGVGFNFAALGITGNLNLGCDLQGINPLARPTIQAIARYPYQPVTDSPKVSNVIQKTVLSLFNKIVRCVPKGTAPNDQFSQICLVEARDITGSPGPFVGEIVCFATNAEMIQHFTGLAGTLGGGSVNVQGTLLTPAEQAALGKQGAAVLCQRLDAGGRAAVEVFGKGPSNLIVDFVDEGLLRVITFSFATGTGATGTGESTATPTPEQISAVNQAPTVVQTPTGTVTNQPGSVPEVSKPTPATPKAQYRFAKAPELVRPVRGKPYLLVQVNGPAGKVKIRIRLMGAKAQVAAVDRVIDANRLVKVGNLKISAAVRSIRVAIAD